MMTIDQKWLAEAPKTTLTAASHDEKNHMHLVTSSIQAVRFDEVKDRYATRRGGTLKGKPQSVDALMVSEDGETMLVEFKNVPTLREKTRLKVLNQAYSSLILLHDECGISLEDSRRDLDFVVVVKGDSRSKIGDAVSRRAGDSISYGNLDMLEGYCFRKVDVVSASVFADSYLNGYKSAL